jgi:hypothetical protein
LLDKLCYLLEKLDCPYELYYEKEKGMKKFSMIFMIILLCGIFSCAHASTIRYDIMGGIDSEGYNFSGYVDIDSVWYYNGEPYGDLSQPGRRLYYYITDFQFISDAGKCYGNTGYLGLDNYSGESTAHFDNCYIENYVGKDNSLHWYNGSTGVWFNEIDNEYHEYSYYTIIPDKIYIYPSYLMRGGVDTYWGPALGSSNTLLELTKSPQPVPEPASLLLLGSGLLGFGLRKKLER